jgi:integrase/recombinase XerD
VLKYLKLKAAQAGLLGVSTHSGRRSLITHLARSGTDIRTIQEITGHRSLANLQRYIETDPDRVRNALENFAYG